MAAVIHHHQENSDHSTYTVNLHGSEITVTVTSLSSVVEKWIKTTFALNRYRYQWMSLLIGIAVDPKGDTLQLCVGNRCLIFQISRADSISDRLRNFLMDRQCGFVRFKNPSLSNTLKNSSKYSLELFIDPLDLTIFKEEYDHDSVEQMIYKILGINVELREDIRMSNWSQECLTDDQVAYACVQTYCACLAGFKFKAWLHCL